MKKIQNFKINRRILIIGILVLLMILSIALISCNNKEIRTIVSKLFGEEPIKEIIYEVYSNENNILRFLITATDTENGIKEIEYPDGDKLICKGQNQISLDYNIETNGTYTFKSISTTGEERTTQIVVDDNYRANIIPIEKIQEISIEKDYRVDYGNTNTTWYYSIGENNENWIETDRNIINIDGYDAFLKEQISEDRTITLNLKKVDEFGNKVEISYKLDEFNVPEDLYNKEEQIIEGESIIACVRDNEIKSGNYTLKVNGEEYPAEIYNYDENVNYITNKNLGTTEDDSRMLIMKYKENLSIQENNLITAQARKKGMFIYVDGELTNNGEISMTARGANAIGQDVYLWKHENGAYEYVPAAGGAGGKSVSATTGQANSSKSTPGRPGENGINRQTGGGGSGSAYFSITVGSPINISSGAGSTGTSYSGGTGGGSGVGSVYGYSWSGGSYKTEKQGTAGKADGGAGGTGAADGAGNPSGGTGGLLILYANRLNNENGKIQSIGTSVSGGASGGGSINIFYNELINQGTIDAFGGKGAGNGGDGCITLQNINIKLPTITVDEITDKSFRVNIENNNPNIEGITYDYYINGVKRIENTTSLSQVISDLHWDTQYTVKVIMNYDGYKMESNEEIITTLIKEGMLDIDFDRIIYIDSINGNNATGNGSLSKPYATLDKIADSGIIENGYSYGIVLKDGRYQLTTKVFELNCNKQLYIIGHREKTILEVKSIYPNYSSSQEGGSTNYTVNICRLVWKGLPHNTHNTISLKTNVNFNSVLFKDITTDGWTSYFDPRQNGNMNFNNCSLTEKVDALLRTSDGGTIKLTNCYGGFTSGYGTSDSSWNYQTNYITSTPQIDGTTYRITDDESVWKGVGTGRNPDGTQADLGVYGGQYSWDYETDLD